MQLNITFTFSGHSTGSAKNAVLILLAMFLAAMPQYRKTKH